MSEHTVDPRRCLVHGLTRIEHANDFGGGAARVSWWECPQCNLGIAAASSPPSAPEATPARCEHWFNEAGVCIHCGTHSPRFESPPETTAPTATEPKCWRCGENADHFVHGEHPHDRQRAMVTGRTCHAFAPPFSSSPATPDVTAWVVVKDGISGGLRYFVNRPLRERFATWTSDNLRALRFASKAAAELLASGLEEDARVEEHMWVDVPRESASPATPTETPTNWTDDPHPMLALSFVLAAMGHVDMAGFLTERHFALASSQQEVERLRAALTEIEALFLGTDSMGTGFAQTYRIARAALTTEPR